MSDEGHGGLDGLEEAAEALDIERGTHPLYFDKGLERNHTRSLYQKAKAAKVGSKVQCPVCGKMFVKKSYQQAFCCNKGKHNCKDRYWNDATDSRRFRMQIMTRS